ncbi:MAG: Hpt domain-containing protein, partial [Gammaproteobacteria bacterium]
MPDTDDDILQDFLVEAGELLEQLGEQLVELEQRPHDTELLNAVFRGFHTVKGGAGFLSLTPLVEVCHRAEDVFNLLRQGKRAVDAPLMDTVLRVLDVVNAMFRQLRAGQSLTPAGSGLLQELVALTSAAPAPAAPKATPAPKADPKPKTKPSSKAKPAPESAPDAEFEMIRDALGGAQPAGGGPGAGDDTITDDEFEALLDELHADSGASTASTAQEIPAAVGAGDDGITDHEFDSLLDQLYGAGGAPGMVDPVDLPEPVPVAVDVPPVVTAPGPAAPGAESGGPAAGASAAANSENTVRVDTRRLDIIMNLVGELVLVRNRLETLKATIPDGAMAKAVSNLGLVTSDL